MHENIKSEQKMKFLLQINIFSYLKQLDLITSQSIIFISSRNIDGMHVTVKVLNLFNVYIN